MLLAAYLSTYVPSKALTTSWIDRKKMEKKTSDKIRWELGYSFPLVMPFMEHIPSIPFHSQVHHIRPANWHGSMAGAHLDIKPCVCVWSVSQSVLVDQYWWFGFMFYSNCDNVVMNNRFGPIASQCLLFVWKPMLWLFICIYQTRMHKLGHDNLHGCWLFMMVLDI